MSIRVVCIRLENSDSFTGWNAEKDCSKGGVVFIKRIKQRTLCKEQYGNKLRKESIAYLITLRCVSVVDRQKTVQVNDVLNNYWRSVSKIRHFVSCIICPVFFSTIEPINLSGVFKKHGKAALTPPPIQVKTRLFFFFFIRFEVQLETNINTNLIILKCMLLTYLYFSVHKS